METKKNIITSNLKVITEFDQSMFESEPSWVVSATLCANGFIIGHSLPTFKLKAVRGSHTPSDADRDSWDFKLIGSYCGDANWLNTVIDKEACLSA